MNKSNILLFFTFFSFVSCSLDYGKQVDVREVVPEFIFTNAHLERYEENKISADVNAGILEQYSDSTVSYAKDIEFTSFDKNGEIETEGSCGFLSADTKNEIYELYDNIKLFSKTQKSSFFADSLIWNSKTEQLISSQNDSVHIQRDDIDLYGNGFSASGVSSKFEFSGNVEGKIITKESDENSGEIQNVQDEENGEN